MEKNKKSIEISVKNKKRNYVTEDEIIKEIVKKEITSQVKFEQRWNFLNAENIKSYRQLQEYYSIDEQLLEKHSKYHKRHDSVSRNESYQSTFKEVPVLSSNTIGWRSAKLENTLEIFGPLYLSSKTFINPNFRLKGTPTYNIILG